MLQTVQLQISIWRILLYSIIILGNIVTIGSTLNLIISIPEFIYVFYLLFKNQIDKALFYHIVFVITSISATNAAGMEIDNTLLYSYARLKIIGPIGASYLMSIILLLLSLHNKLKVPRSNLFYKLFNGLLIMAISGFTIGLLGFILDSHYSMEGILNYGVYITIVLINMYALILNYSDRLTKRFYDDVLPLLVASVYSSAFAYFILHISTTYGGLSNIILKADLSYYASILLLAYSFVSKKIRILFPFLVFLILTYNTSGGKEIIILGLVVVFFIIGILGNRSSKNNLWLYVLSAILLFVIIMGIRTAEDTLFSRKVGEVTSMFSSDITDISTSPYIRVASTLNILQGYILHPYWMLFGSGYGGYYEDYLHLFAHLNLGHGSFSQQDISSGFFHTAHDTFAVVPLVNGLFGLWIIIKFSIKYIKRIKYNFCAFAAIPWLLLTFYFNIQLALTGVYLLFSCEYVVANSLKDKLKKV